VQSTRMPAAMPAHSRRMEASAAARVSVCSVRTVPRIVQVSGMMLWVVPPFTAPTVTTAGRIGDVSRETTVCNCPISAAAATMGSTE
jgi:hypothetical protein